jgi:predicted ester cyclase
MRSLPTGRSVVPLLILLGGVAGCRSPHLESLSPLQLLFERALTLRDTAALHRAVGPTLIFHAHGDSAVLPRDQLWQMAQPILTAFPDVQFHVEEQVRSGGKVAARVLLTGTHRGQWKDLAPTGRAVRVSEMFLCRLANGQLVECWQEWDEAGLYRQLTAPR